MLRPMFKSLISIALIAIAGHGGLAAAATVNYPYIDVIDEGTGVVSATGAVPSLTLQATAAYIVDGPGSYTYLPAGTPFTLTASYSASLTQADGQANSYDYTNGVITVGTAGSPLLTATVSDLVLQSVSTGLGASVIATGAIDYTGGSLAGSLPGGEIIANFLVQPTVTNASGYAVLSDDFSGSSLTAKVGSVVPLPAALPLLVSGFGLLLGAGATRRRR